MNFNNYSIYLKIMKIILVLFYDMTYLCKIFGVILK